LLERTGSELETLAATGAAGGAVESVDEPLEHAANMAVAATAATRRRHVDAGEHGADR
jgi:hypothetical protein